MALTAAALTAFNTSTTIQPASALDTNFTECGTESLVYAGIAAGTANEIDLTIPLVITNYWIGMVVRFVAAHNNTASADVNINGLSSNILVTDISGTALTANAIVSGNIYELTLVQDAVQALTFRITGTGGSAPVSSVFGRTGAVVAAAPDYAGFYANLNGSASNLFSAANGTSANQVVNFSQFAATIAQTGSQALPTGFIFKIIPLPSKSQDDGQFTVNFSSAFPTACFGAIPSTINAGGGTGLDSFVQVVSVTTGGATFLVQATGSSPTGSKVTGFAIAVGH